MARKKQTDLKLSSQQRIKQTWGKMDQWFALCSVSLWIVGVAVVSVLAMIHKSIDYTLFTVHPMVYPHVYRLSFLFSLMALMVKVERDGFAFILNRPAVAFFGFTAVWILVSAFASCSFEYFVHPQEVRGESAVIQVYYFLFLFPSVALITDETMKHCILRGMLFFSVILAVAAFVLWHTQNTSAVFLDWRPAFTSIYANTNYYGYMLSMMLPLSAASFLRERSFLWRLFSFAVLVLNTIALVLNITRGAWLACLLSVVFLLTTQRASAKRVNSFTLVVSVAFFICLIVLIYTNNSLQWEWNKTVAEIKKIFAGSERVDGVGSGRWGLWKLALEYIKLYPLFGIGFEGMLTKGLNLIAGQPRPHNEYLQYALFYGLPAGLAYLSGCISVFLQALRRRATLSAATITALIGAFGYLVSAFFGLTLSYITPFLFILLGLSYAEKQPTSDYLVSWKG